jgi:hypothetical protein
MVRLERIPKCHNKKVNRLAQGAFGYRPILALKKPGDDCRKEIVIIGRQSGMIASTITKDVRGVNFESVQRVPASTMNPTVKPAHILGGSMPF